MRPSRTLALCLPALLQAQGTDLAEAQALLRAGDLPRARAAFEAWLANHPRDADALVGAGFTALRQGRLADAHACFERALAVAPRYADAAYGMALALERRKELEPARRWLREALALEPSRPEFREAQARLDPPPPPPPPAQVRPAALQAPYKVDLQGFQIQDGQGGWRPLFLKGMNLGAALPGKFPSEFPDKATYVGWLRDMAELGVNALRAYTIHPPAFYEALREHNLAAARPIYLVHGVWTEPPPEDEFEDPAWFQAWVAEMRRVVDLLHGRADLPPRPGHASGAYRADVSPWWIATLLGREWEPNGIWAFHQRHPGTADWRGRYLEVLDGNATERFMTRAMDTFLALEMDGYHAQRPIAFTNWPTLDPLRHPTESTHAEEVKLRKGLGLPVVEGEVDTHWDEDATGLDMEKVHPLAGFTAGCFASYHAYPYYPDFMNLDPGYRAARDAQGPNSYLGYLRDLVRHHRRTPVIIAEFGIPSSRLVAHAQPQGLNHGGLNEREHGLANARLFRNVRESGCAGGFLFAWIDEWFKRNWLTQRFELPPERNPLWYNPLDAEQNYGLLGLHPGEGGPSLVIDGDPSDWAKVPVYARAQGLTLKLLADEGWFHLGLAWDPQALPAGDRWLLGLDTLDPRLGAKRLPFDVPLSSEAGLEFVLLRDHRGLSLWVDGPYDPSLHRHPRPYASVDHEGGPWLQPQTESNRERVGRDGTHFAPVRQDVGILRRGTSDRRDPAFDSLAEWQERPGFLEVRIPWGLLNVTDPSSRRVIQEARPLKETLGTVVTPGFRVVAVRLAGARVLASVPGAREGMLSAPPLYTWPGWEQPRWHAFRKQSFDILKAALAALPDTPLARSAP